MSEKKQLLEDLREEIVVLGTASGMLAAAVGADRTVIDEQMNKALRILKQLEAEKEGK